MSRPPAERRAAAVRLSRLPAVRFGPLRSKTLPHGGLLGPVSILHERLPPRTAMPAIRHRRTAEWVYCTAGSMTAELGRRRLRVRAGTVLVIPPGVRHRFATGAEPCEALSVFRPALALGPGADVVVDTRPRRIDRRRRRG